MSDDFAYQVEPFADLMVRLDDPFAERARVLTSAALDEDRLRNLIDAWRVRFERDAEGSLAERFATTYAERRTGLLEQRRRAASGEQDAPDARFLNADAQSFREEAAHVARDRVDDSAEAAAPQPVLRSELSGLLSAPRMPEPSGIMPAPRAPEPSGLMPAPRAPEPSGLMPAPRAPEPSGLLPSPWAPRETPELPAPLPPAPISAPPAVVRPPERLAGTADISAFVPRIALPFAASPDSSAPGPSSHSAPATTSPQTPPDPGAQRAPEPLPPSTASPSRVGSGTADISSVVPRHLFPFPAKTAPPNVPQINTHDPSAAPPLSSTLGGAGPAEPRRRLIRFDPQTGQPLPAPMWVDLPPEPEGSKK